MNRLVGLFLLIPVALLEQRLEAGFLPNGVASGDVTQSSAVLWARSDMAGDVTFQISKDPTFSSGVINHSVSVVDPLAPAKWHVGGLSSNQEYFYRASAPGGGEVASGRFQTNAPLGGHYGLKFGVTGDWRGELAPYLGLKNATTSHLDFMVKLGDTIYADFPSPDLPVSQATTLEEYRIKHNEVYSERHGLNAWRDLQATTPIYATIDDHEVFDDFSGGALASSDPRVAGEMVNFVNQTSFYKNGLHAFGEYNALEDRTNSTPGNERFDGTPDLYRSRTFGSDAALIMLDARSFRDKELETASTGEFLVRSLTETSRTMLGDVQLARLFADLKAADDAGVTWKFVVVPEPIQNLGPVAAGDRFEGYAAERSAILSYIKDQGIDNVVFVSADIHGTIINNLTFQSASHPASIFGPQIATNAFEITTGSLAFHEPFGPTVIELAEALGFIGQGDIPPPFNGFGFPTFRAFYDFLGSIGLTSLQEGIITNLLNQQLASVPSPYDPVGLDANLPIAAGLIDAILLQGGWTATNTYGWTEFEIDSWSQVLTVTTWGIDYYSLADLLDPTRVLGRTPRIVSQFQVTPQNFVPVPEPSSMLLGVLGTSLFGIALRRRKTSK